jgi:DNA-binding CsgD family transcriptional regulator
MSAQPDAQWLRMADVIHAATPRRRRQRSCSAHWITQAALTPQQRNVVALGLAGQRVSEIAAVLNRTRPEVCRDLTSALRALQNAHAATTQPGVADIASPAAAHREQGRRR